SNLLGRDHMLAAALLLSAALAQGPSDEAIAIARESIILDGHIDMPYQVASHGADISKFSERMNFDYEKAMEGGVNAPFIVAYIAARFQETGGAKAEADRMIGLVEGIAYQHPDKFEIARSVRDVRRITRDGRIAFPLGMENGAAIEGSLENLVHFYDRGIRYITLTHGRVNHISDSSYDEERKWGGLSPFGYLLVSAMNDIGMMVDISHVTDEAFFDVMDVTRTPVVATHSSLRHFTPGFERNMSDEMLLALAENGGVLLIAFGSAFLTEEANGYSSRREEAYEQHKERAGRRAMSEEDFNEEWEADNPYPYATVSDVADHIDRVVDLVGLDHVGIGSDFDGLGDTLPIGLKDASDMPNLVQELLDRNYDRDDIELILGGNFMRVWREVEKARR
ncbi:MAG: dipeptidase, partial [Pseudomonadota bacterium]